MYEVGYVGVCVCWWGVVGVWRGCVCMWVWVCVGVCGMWVGCIRWGMWKCVYVGGGYVVCELLAGEGLGSIFPKCPDLLEGSIYVF